MYHNYSLLYGYNIENLNKNVGLNFVTQYSIVLRVAIKHFGILLFGLFLVHSL